MTANWNVTSRTQAFIYPSIIALLCDSWINHFAGMRATENYAVTQKITQALPELHGCRTYQITTPTNTNSVK